MIEHAKTAGPCHLGPARAASSGSLDAGICRLKVVLSALDRYNWYRFADQPALLNAGLTKEERERLQTRVEKIHRSWTKDRDYLAPPAMGELAEIDPALVVNPPKGLEVGYVPIATRQTAEE